MPPSAPSPRASARIPQPLSPADLRRRAYARLAALADPLKSRHKPLSLLRLEARRSLEEFLDAERPAMPPAERDRLAEELFAECPGLGPLEELFRDAAVQEVMLLSTGQVIVRRGGDWTPTSVRFRDAAQVRQALARYAEAGEPLGGSATGGLDVWLANGFRAVAVLPPEVMDLPPAAVFVRAEKPVPPPPPPAAVVAPSSVVQPAPAPRPEPPGTGVVRPPSSRILAPADRTDPYAPLRQQVMRKIVSKFAAAGVYDLNRIAHAELRRIVQAYVQEVCAEERLWLDEDFRDRLTLEILAGMNR